MKEKDLEQIKTIKELNVYLQNKLQHSSSFKEGITNFILSARSLADHYLLFSPEDTIALGDSIITACHIINWGIINTTSLLQAVEHSSVANFAQKYDQKQIEELTKKLPKEIVTIRDMAWPLDYSADTEEEKADQKKIWIKVSKIIDEMFETYFIKEDRKIYNNVLERLLHSKV